MRRFSSKLNSLAEIPPRVFECRLAMIQPSTVRSPNGKWCDEANELFQRYVDAGAVELEVFSVVDSIANVFIKIQNKTLNDILVEQQLGRKCDENYLSKVRTFSAILRKSIMGTDANSKSWHEVAIMAVTDW